MTAFSWVRGGEDENKYLYQGKEYQSPTGLHDFHARQYDAVLVGGLPLTLLDNLVVHI